MKFTVTFEAQNAAVRVNPRDIGLSGLDLIRRELGAPRLPMERVRDQSYGTIDNPRIALSEEDARRAGHFENANSVSVKVPDDSLVGYVRPHVVAQRDNVTGEIIHAWIEYRVDESSIVRDWLNAGAPLEWDPRGGGAR